VDQREIDKPSDGNESYTGLTKLEPETAVMFRKKAEPQTPEPTADVVMYCTEWCPGCRSARAFLKEYDIDYVEVDISKDRAAAARVRGWADGNETTPTLNIRGTIVVDWDQRKVAQLLGLR
jgi:glutaredoxin